MKFLNVFVPRLASVRSIVLFLLPVVVMAGTFGGVGFSERAKLFLFVFGVTVFSLLVLAEWFSTGGAPRRSSPWQIVIVGLLITLLLSFAFSVNYFSSIVGESGGASNTIVSLLLGLVFTWLLWQSTRSASDLTWLFSGWLLAVILGGMDVIATFFFQPFLTRSLGVEGQTLTILAPQFKQNALLFALTIPLALSSLLQRPTAVTQKIQWGIALLASIVCVVALVLLNTSLGFVMLAIASIIALLFLAYSGRQHSGMLIVLTALSVIGIAFWVFPIGKFLGIREGVDSGIDAENSWNVTVRALSDQWMFGVGPENFGTVFAQHAQRSFFLTDTSGVLYTVSGNQLTQLLSTIGLIPTLLLYGLFAALLCIALWSFQKNRQELTPRRLLLLAMAIGLGISWWSVTFSMSLQMMFWIVLAALLILYAPIDERSTKRSSALLGLLSGVLLLVLLVTIVVFGNVWRAETVIADYQRSSRANELNEEIEKRTELLASFQPMSASYAIARTRVLLQAMNANRGSVEDATSEILAITSSLTQEFYEDPTVLAQTADILTTLRTTQSEQAFDAEISALYLRAIELNTDDPYLRLQLAQNLVDRVSWDQRQAWIGEDERDEAAQALQQAALFLDSAEHLLNRPGAFQELRTDILERLQEF